MDGLHQVIVEIEDLLFITFLITKLPNLLIDSQLIVNLLMEHVNPIIMDVLVYHLIHSKENGIISTMDILTPSVLHLHLSNLMMTSFMKFHLQLNITSHFRNFISLSVLPMLIMSMVFMEMSNSTMEQDLMLVPKPTLPLGSARMLKLIQLFLLLKLM